METTTAVIFSILDYEVTVICLDKRPAFGRYLNSSRKPKLGDFAQETVHWDLNLHKGHSGSWRCGDAHSRLSFCIHTVCLTSVMRKSPDLILTVY